jgi:hypothetical protein
MIASVRYGREHKRLPVALERLFDSLYTSGSDVHHGASDNDPLICVQSETHRDTQFSIALLLCLLFIVVLSAGEAILHVLIVVTQRPETGQQLMVGLGSLVTNGIGSNLQESFNSADSDSKNGDCTAPPNLSLPLRFNRAEHSAVGRGR